MFKQKISNYDFPSFTKKEKGNRKLERSEDLAEIWMPARLEQTAQNPLKLQGRALSSVVHLQAYHSFQGPVLAVQSK